MRLWRRWRARRARRYAIRVTAFGIHGEPLPERWKREDDAAAAARRMSGGFGTPQYETIQIAERI